MRRATGLSCLFILVAGACVGEIDGVVPSAEFDEEAGPRGIYVVTADLDQLSTDEAALPLEAAAPRIIFLNMGGGTYTPGSNNSSTNRSSIVSQTSSVPAYEGTAQQRSQLLTCVQGQFSRFNVQVTDVDPGAAVHIEAVMGGRPENIGMQSGVGGVAPMFGDCSVVERAVVYIFTQVFSSVQVECEVAGQEIAHAYGLDHEMLCKDPMTYLSSCGAKSFQDQAANCGEYSARECMCGGTTQNSYQELLATLGAGSTTPPPPPPPPPPGDTTPPSVAIGSPNDGAVVPANSTISIVATATDNVGVADVELIWQQPATVVVKCSAPQSGVTCNKSGSTYTFSFKVGTGARSFAVRARDAAANSATTTTRSITLGDSTPPPPPPPSTGPTVSLTSPVAGASIRRGDLIAVRANATDDGALTQVRLAWTSTSTTYFTLSDLGGGVWGIDLRLSTSAVYGARTLVVTATDDDGNSSATAGLTVQVVP